MMAGSQTMTYRLDPPASWSNVRADTWTPYFLTLLPCLPSPKPQTIPDGILALQVGINEEFAGITWWKLFYGFSLFALVIRSLRILSIFPR
jgi:hypothetical protein